MIFQAIISFPAIVNILMNAAPDNIDIKQVKKAILKIDNVKNVHHYANLVVIKKQDIV